MSKVIKKELNPIHNNIEVNLAILGIGNIMGEEMIL